MTVPSYDGQYDQRHNRAKDRGQAALFRFGHGLLPGWKNQNENCTEGQNHVRCGHDGVEPETLQDQDAGADQGRRAMMAIGQLGGPDMLHIRGGRDHPVQHGNGDGRQRCALRKAIPEIE